MNKILITGASGMLGSTLVMKYQDNFEVFATDKTNFKGNPANKFSSFDLLSNSLDEIIEWSKPDFIIHCAAITNLDYCEEHPQQALKVNAESVQKFFQSNTKAKLIFISSDAVFADGMYMVSEKNETAPETVYGKSKEVGEKHIREAGYPHLAIRTTIVGKNLNTQRRGFVEWMVGSLRKGKEITIFDDTLFTPITIWHLAEEIEWIMGQDISGFIHIAGTDPVSKYDFCFRICKNLGLDTDLMRKGSIENMSFKARRSKDQTLDSTYYQNQTGRSLPSTEDTVELITKHFKDLAYS